MLRFLASTALHLLGNAVGLIVASLVLDGFRLQPLGFVFSVLFFTAVEVLLGPFVLKMAITHLPALRGGIALVTTFVGLFLTTLFTGGLQIEGLSTWILAPLIVWVAVLLAAILLPMVLFKKLLAPQSDQPAAKPSI
jgi:hypothetical protein